MKFTLTIFALLSASVSTMRLTAETEVMSLANMDAMTLASLDASIMEGDFELSSLTPAQQAQVVSTAKKSMTDMDTNHDGKVSFAEAKAFFMASLLRQYPNVSDATKNSVLKMFTNLFNKYDTNHDGFLEMNEL